jgi:prepilin-type N-terminal cleavage/methylation domain-containing protein
MKNQKAFTLIELLIVIAIIGILAVTTVLVMRNVRFKAKDASFRSSVSSVKTVWTACCEAGGNIQPKGATDGEGIYICDDPSIIDGKYPGDANIGNVTIDVQCDQHGHFEATVTPGTDNKGACVSVTYDETGEISNVSCY